MNLLQRLSGLLVLAFLIGCQSSNVNFLGLDPERETTTTTTNPRPEAVTDEQTDETKRSKAPRLKRSFEDGEYETAIEEFKKDLEDDPNSPFINYYIAESYRKSNRIYLAPDYYSKAIEGGYNDQEMELHYAKALKANENYEEAKKVLKNYLEYVTVDAFATRARNELTNLDKLDSIRLDVKKIEVRPLTGINTENAEYSPYYHEGYLYFSSTRETGDPFKGDGSGFSDLYKVKISGLTPEPGSLASLEDLINSQGINEGTIAFSPDGNTMIFAKGNSGKKRGRQDVDLFITQKKNDKWGQPQLMPINSPDSWDSNPTFNQSGNVIYFASDRPGGEGGIDIYRASLNDRGRWGNVTNMGSVINTPENEMFPYVSADNKLYFASEGHPGLGMLDMFEAVNRGGNITIRNMGASINSAYDDFGLVFSDFPFEGFFASNRPGGAGNDDLYAFVDDSPELKKITYVLKGKTYTLNEDSTQTILAGVRVKLMSDDNQVIDDVYTGRGGTFEFPVDPEKEYILIGEKADYFTTRKDFSTLGETVPQEDLVDRFNTKVFESSLTLDPIVLEKTIVLENIYYDLNKAEIRPDAALELDKLAQLLIDNPEIRIELSSHTDSRADDDFNLDLSQRRAKSAIDYLVSKGILPARLVAKGYGETQLIIPDAQTEEEHQKNRRTEFKVIEYDKSKRNDN